MSHLQVAPEVAEALAAGQPVVALESALITHGLAGPANLEVARAMEAAVREEGAVPATVAILSGQAHVGLEEAELERLAAGGAYKVSTRDLPVALGLGQDGGTTVAATLHLAHQAGLHVLATGGIGGVHRGAGHDVSADLPALARIPLVVVCAGAKAVLDLARTREFLETHGVPVLGYGTDRFPAFYSRESLLPVDTRVETPQQIARIARARAELGLPQALLVCVPVPEADELPGGEAETAVARAVEEAEVAGVSGKLLTPFLLRRVVELTGGRAERANQALLLNNARVAARIAQALADGD